MSLAATINTNEYYLDMLGIRRWGWQNAKLNTKSVTWFSEGDNTEFVVVLADFPKILAEWHLLDAILLALGRHRADIYTVILQQDAKDNAEKMVEFLNSLEATRILCFGGDDFVGCKPVPLVLPMLKDIISSPMIKRDVHKQLLAKNYFNKNT